MCIRDREYDDIPTILRILEKYLPDYDLSRADMASSLSFSLAEGYIRQECRFRNLLNSQDVYYFLKDVAKKLREEPESAKEIDVYKRQAVQSGNPKNITGLSDLTGDGVSLIMGDVDSTPIGKIAKKAMTDAGIFDQVKIEATTATAPQMSTALAAGEADAAIVWKENCDAEGVEIVDTKDLDPYIKTIPAASLSCASDKDALAAFNQYLDSDTVKEIWVKYGYEIVE